MNAAKGLVHADYRAQKYRLLYSYLAFLILPPVSDMLSADLTLLPPALGKNQARRPKKGHRLRRRMRSNGEFNSSTKDNVPTSAAYGLVDSATLSSSQAPQPSLLAGASSQAAVISLLWKYAVGRTLCRAAYLNGSECQ